MKGKKKWILVAVVAVLVLAGAITAALLWEEQEEHSETYDMVAQAISKTEALEDVGFQISSEAMITDNGTLRKTETSGYIYKLADLQRIFVYVNTKSTTPEDPSQDFDVTVSMFSDGEHVYDNSGATDVIVDMTCEEFDQIVSGYGLYEYDEADVVQVAYAENELEIYDGGEMVVTLSKPSDAVLEAIAGSLSEVLGESVTKEELVTVSARVDYSIYDGMVTAQSCNFTVEHTCDDGRKVRYASATHVIMLENDETGDQETVPVT